MEKPGHTVCNSPAVKKVEAKRYLETLRYPDHISTAACPTNVAAGGRWGEESGSLGSQGAPVQNTLVRGKLFSFPLLGALAWSDTESERARLRETV